jgi:hypothetical protein
MGEDKTYPINDTNRAIGQVIKDLKQWEAPRPTLAESNYYYEARRGQLWSLNLIKEEPWGN